MYRRSFFKFFAVFPAVLLGGFALAAGPGIQIRDLPKDLRAFEFSNRGTQPREFMTLAENEMEYLLCVMRQVNNKTRAAEILGIDRVSLWRKMRRHEIEDL